MLILGHQINVVSLPWTRLTVEVVGNVPGNVPGQSFVSFLDQDPKYTDWVRLSS